MTTEEVDPTAGGTSSPGVDPNLEAAPSPGWEEPRNDEEEGPLEQEERTGCVEEVDDDDVSSELSALVVPYPDLAPVVFFCLKQTTFPRSWCIRLVCSPYPFLLNTLL
ncbi:uncharacterized protein [Salminus brasiliensis]|uniref:uncharacterized protein n=1 Tax=Salminus brasiliensis TaxID=930266 RepID=UPI003B82F117